MGSGDVYKRQVIVCILIVSCVIFRFGYFEPIGWPFGFLNWALGERHSVGQVCSDVSNSTLQTESLYDPLDIF